MNILDLLSTSIDCSYRYPHNEVSDDASQELYYYLFRDIDENHKEFPIGVINNTSNYLENQALEVCDNSEPYHYTIFPKTGTSMLASFIGKSSNLMENFRWDASSDSTAAKGIFSLLMDSDLNTIFEATKVVNLTNQNVEKIILRISKRFMEEDNRLSKYFKGSMLKHLINGSVLYRGVRLPVEIIIKDNFISPLCRPNPAIENPERHEEELRRCLMAHSNALSAEIVR